MATFKDRIEDLAGTIPATADGEQFLKDGVVDVVHRTITAHPQHIPLFTKQVTIATPSLGEDVHDVHVAEVTKDGTACREIPASGRHAATDSASLHYASDNDPVYYFLNEKIYIKPASGTQTFSILEHGDVTNWDSGTSSITYMPSHHYNQVIMYAGIQTLHHKMVEMNSNTDIDTAFTAVNTELDETQALADLVNTQVDSSVTEIAKAVTEADEIITQTDNASDFATALTAMNTAVDKFRADADDPALLGDETQYLTGVGLAHVKDALDNARTIIDDGANSPTGNAAGDAATYLYTDEDTELLQGALGIAASEIQRAQAHIAEWNSTVQTLQTEINGFATEVQSRAAFTGAKGQAVQAIIADSGAYLSAAQGYLNEVQTKIAIANGYIGELNTRIARDNQTYQWYGTQIAALQQQYNASFMVSGQQ